MSHKQGYLHVGCRSGWGDGHKEGIEGVDLGCGLRRVGIRDYDNLIPQFLNPKTYRGVKNNLCRIEI